jgi:serralysin
MELRMTRAIAYRSTDMSNMPVWLGNIDQAEADRIVLSDGVHTATYKGDFAYSYFGEVFGTLKGYGQTYLGRPDLEVSGFSVDANRAFTLINAGNAERLLELVFRGSDRITGSNEHDVLLGYKGADRIEGNSGKDELKGGSGGDRLDGGKGKDWLDGGEGKDRLTGGEGQDILRGGKGADIFIFKNERDTGKGSLADQIMDFSVEADRVDLSDIDADPKRTGNDAFHFVGEAAFSGSRGELRFADSKLIADLDGDGRTNFEIRLKGTSYFDGDDLIL